MVATPIGNLQDISTRALQALREVDVIAAEDTRHSRILLQHFSVDTRLISLHQHNELKQTEYLVHELKNGLSLALISDAGTPAISDPGYHLIQAAHQANVAVIAIPGASALITALSMSGLPADKFFFYGFLPSKATQRQSTLQSLQFFTETLVFYEAPHRIVAMLADLVSIFGEDRQGFLSRELTKLYENYYFGSLFEIQQWLQNHPEQVRGEFVICVAGSKAKEAEEDIQTAENVLEPLLAELPMKQAVSLATQITGFKKNYLYELALSLKDPS